jgi:hypothetical protein
MPKAPVDVMGLQKVNAYYHFPGQVGLLAVLSPKAKQRRNHAFTPNGPGWQTSREGFRRHNDMEEPS